MFFSSNSITALSALSLLASAGHAGAYHQDLKYHRNSRRAAPGFVDVPLAELQMLQSEYNTFHGWMTAYISTAGSSNLPVTQLNQDVIAYDVWMNTFLGKYTNSTSASAAATSTGGMPAAATPYTLPAVPSSPPLSNGSSSNASETFNAQSSSNVAVYYGQSGATAQVTLDSLCQDQNVDIVVLAFVTEFFGPGGYPTINFGPDCSNTTVAGGVAKNATGLTDCPFLAKNISTCQNLGKKVLLSLGGASGSTAFSSDAQAKTFANTLWTVFGGGMTDLTLRPFGSVKLDGFDVDNEDHSTNYYNTFISALRTTYAQDKTKTYYVSAAPQCPRPDASIPLAGMQTMDFVFVQFYNNAMAGCDIGQPGFVDSLKAWSGDLSSNSTIAGKGPRLYVGAPACDSCAGKGYLDPDTMQKVIKSATAAGIPNLGGVMLWDGAQAKINLNTTGDYLQVVKSALA